MNALSRRNALKLAGLTAALPLSELLGQTTQPPPDNSPARFTLGMASYTFRAFTLEQAIAMTLRLGIRRMTLKDMHLPLSSSDEEIAFVLRKLNEAGIELSGCGVIYMTSETEVHRAFAYAKSAGIRMIVGVPESGLLDLVERKVKETGIALAIHNHGPGDKRYPTPESAYTAVSGRDPRMGLCIDIGHTQRSGLDPTAEIERCFDRLLDIHCKDVSASDAKGSTVEIGRGVIDIPRLLKTLKRLNYDRTLHCEHEKDESDPLPGVAESAGYLRGVLSILA